MRIEDILKTSKSLSDSKKTVVNLVYTANLVNYKLNDVLKSHGISLEQFNVLRILRGQKGVASTLANVQERMVTKSSNATRLIDKLIAKGYVTKEVNAKNKRKININITDKGLEALKILDVLIDNTEKDITSQLTKEESRELNKLLEKIRLIAN
ncbi:MarR family transcriptional regulator [Hanstruepera neustonica]|uniref:MarR family transcriptional regulator n=1 Tax=Hanstruepera neustonica TaxID=1445657 RepID=A0A2K1E0J2_9FLAO|nr:MarR family transcriptional regulator [Hanstruepera neustonica]PNQ73771.1 MarR family transcriptional regulator [Hanstruepera neustonica]